MLKSLLPKLILGAPNAFISERQITDNIMVAYEMIHFLRCKKKGKQGYMSIKLDMNKAYDRVKWEYLK